jgi:hypothetical protein
VLRELLLCVAVCAVAAGENRPDVATEAPIVKTFMIPPLPDDGHPSLYTCGGFLAVISNKSWLLDWRVDGCAHGEMRRIQWSNLEAPPVVTPLLRPYEAAMLGDGTIVETVLLGLPRKRLLEAAQEKNRKAPEWMSPEEVQADSQERLERKNRLKRSAEREDRIVAQMKYLQEIARTGEKGLVIRDMAGARYMMIDRSDNEMGPFSGMSSSKNGKWLGVWKLENVKMPKDKAASETVRVGIVDQSNRMIRSVGITKPGFPIEMVISDDGRRLVLFGAVIGKAGWICMIDLQKQAVLWNRDDIAETACFSSGDISPNGKRIYAADEQGGVFCLDGDSGKQLAKWDIAGAIILSPDGRFLAVMSGGSLHRVAVHEAESGKLVQYVTARGPHFDAAFSPDSRFLAIGTNNAIRIYDLPAALKGKRGQHPAENASRVPHAERKRPTIPGTTPPQ